MMRYQYLASGLFELVVIMALNVTMMSRSPEYANPLSEPRGALVHTDMAAYVRTSDCSDGTFSHSRRHELFKEGLPQILHASCLNCRKKFFLTNILLITRLTLKFSLWQLHIALQISIELL